MASSLQRIGDLEINQDLNAQRKTWIFQRIGWVGMALVILAAMGGLFGSGLFARTVTTDNRQLFSLEYDRFGRYENDFLLQLVLTPEATKTPYVTLWIDRLYWTHHAIEHLTPEPVNSRTGSEGFAYTFEVSAQNAPAVIAIRLRPQYRGMGDGYIRLNDQGSIRFQQFIFP